MMQEQEKKTIKNHLLYLTKNVGSIKPILDSLYSDAIFQESDIERVDAETTTEDKVRRIVNILLYKDFRAIPSFKEALRETNQHHIVEELEKTVPYQSSQIDDDLKLFISNALRNKFEAADTGSKVSLQDVWEELRKTARCHGRTCEFDNLDDSDIVHIIKTVFTSCKIEHQSPRGKHKRTNIHCIGIWTKDEQYDTIGKTPCNEIDDDLKISSCLGALKICHSKKEQYQQRFKDCEDELQDLHSPAVTVEHDSESSAQYIVPDIVMPFSLEAKIQHSRFKYDFFVSHSNVNRDWVNNYLLYHLETRLHDNDTAFKGCIADRDFTPGRTILRNIIDAVKHSCKIIFVITEDFIKSKWCDYEVEQALIEMLSTKKEDCIIPILLEKIEVQRLPKTLASITYLDLTDESKHYQEVLKLKRALSI